MDNIKEKDVPEEVVLAMKAMYGKKYQKAVNILKSYGFITRWNNIKKCVLTQGPMVYLRCTHEECIEYISFYIHLYAHVDLGLDCLESIQSNYIHYKYYVLNGGNIDDYSMIELAKVSIDLKDHEMVCKLKDEFIRVLKDEIVILSSPDVDADDIIDSNIGTINHVRDLCRVDNNYKHYKRLVIKQVKLPSDIMIDILEIAIQLSDTEIIKAAGIRFVEMLRMMIEIEEDKERCESLLDAVYITSTTRGLSDVVEHMSSKRV